MNNSPQCALCIGYKETLVEETVKMNFLVECYTPTNALSIQ